jgi:hypothetical protein
LVEKLTAHLDPVPSLRMGGAIPILSLYTFMAWTSSILLLHLSTGYDICRKYRNHRSTGTNNDVTTQTRRTKDFENAAICGAQCHCLACSLKRITSGVVNDDSVTSRSGCSVNEDVIAILYTHTSHTAGLEVKPLSSSR